MRAEGVGWLLAWRVARALPERWVVAGFERMSARSYRRNARRRAVVAANLEPVVGTQGLDHAVRDAFRWYGRYWAETFRMQDISEGEFDARLKVEGREHLQAAHDRGGGVFAVPHLGNWDAGGRFACKHWPLTVVVEVLRPRMLFERFVEHRRALGMTIVPLERGGDSTARCLERLAVGDLVALVCDRDLSGSGIEVTMFGRTTKMPAGPAVLALRSGAPLMAACIYQREDGSWFVRVLAPIEVDRDAPDAVARMTQALADAFEGFIREQPAQWHVFGKYWIA